MHKTYLFVLYFLNDLAHMIGKGSNYSLIKFYQCSCYMTFFLASADKSSEGICLVQIYEMQSADLH